MIKVGILGYGNLGRGVEAAVKKNDDMELVAVYTRRDPSTLTIKTPTAAVKSTAVLDTGKEELDILVICGGKITAVLDGRETTKEEIGLYMTKTTRYDDPPEEKEADDLENAN